MSVLSFNDERKLLSLLRENNGAVVVKKHDCFGSACAKNLAHYCYHSNIIFHWSVEYYYFKQIPNVDKCNRALELLRWILENGHFYHTAIEENSDGECNRYDFLDFKEDIIKCSNS